MKKLIVLTLLFLGIGIQMNAQSAPGQMPPLTLEDYFSPSTAVPAGPDAKGFVQRWTLLEPIGKPGLNSNASPIKTSFSSITGHAFPHQEK